MKPLSKAQIYFVIGLSASVVGNILYRIKLEPGYLAVFVAITTDVLNVAGFILFWVGVFGMISNRRKSVREKKLRKQQALEAATQE